MNENAAPVSPPKSASAPSGPLNSTVFANELIQAADYRLAFNALSLDYPDATVDEAYIIQVNTMAQHIQRNDPMCGAKVTVHERRPVFGLYHRTAQMGTFEVLDLSRLIQPRAQAVLVFRLFKELSGTDVTEEDVRDATESVVAGIEIVDYRMGPVDKLRHIDAVADNGYIAKVLVGEHGADISHGWDAIERLPTKFVVDGEEVEQPGDAITAPASAVAALANHLGAQGGMLESDWFITVGPLSASVPLRVGSKMHLTVGAMAPVVLRAR